MVHDDQKHSFPRLRLDTRPKAHAESHYPFAFAPRDPSELESQSIYGSYNNNSSLGLSSSDLLDTLDPHGEDARGINGEGHDDGDSSCLQERANSGDASCSLVNSARASASDVRQPTSRERGTSVSFSSHATLDDGMRHSLDEPLPKPSTSRRRTRGTSFAENSQADHDAHDTPVSGCSPRVNPFTGEPVRRRTKRTETFPKLDRIESAHDQCASPANVPSLISGSSVSPPIDAVSTPISNSMTGSMLLSPDAVASPALSPIMASEPWPMMNRDGPKSRMSSRHASLRNSSRRSSRMSASSPASAFLSQWGKDSLASIVPDPDEEGQTLGVGNEYVVGRQVGYGGFSVVKELHGISDTGEKIRRSVKIVRKNIPNVSESENEKQQQAIEHEIDIWRYLQNEHILPLYAVYDTDFATFCVMDLVEGGTLFDLVRKSRGSTKKGLSPDLAKHYAHQLASALRYLHEDIRMVHRDVKLENCLLELTGQDADTKGGQLRLCDFGLAEFIKGDMYDSIESLDLEDSDGTAAANIVGTIQYAAPESFASSKQIFLPSVDVWAFGVCLFTMVTGDLPFKHSLLPKVTEMIRNGTWDRKMVKSALADHTDTEDILEVLDGCLEVDCNLRWTISDVMSCSWLADLRHDSGKDDWQLLS